MLTGDSEVMESGCLNGGGNSSRCVRPSVVVFSALLRKIVLLSSDSIQSKLRAEELSLTPISKLILFEGEDEMGRLKALLGTAEQGAKSFHDPVTEIIRQNDVEIWEIHNLTPDAHPIHLHMVTMQLIDRQKFSAAVDMETGRPVNIRLQGQPRGPEPGEAGWKDTYISYPGEVMRVIAKFDLAGTYVWHCHILSHEDHEMMRPYTVLPAASTPGKAPLATTTAEPNLQFQAIPNPFNQRLRLEFRLPEPAEVLINIYDSKGALMKSINKGRAIAGWQQAEIDGREWSNGIYFCEVRIGNERLVRKLVLEK